jgi:hypothetical protein
MLTSNASNALLTAASLSALYGSRDGKDKNITSAFKVIGGFSPKILAEVGTAPHEPVRMPTFLRQNGKTDGYKYSRVHVDPNDRSKDR